MKGLFNAYPKNTAFSVSYTTRKPRPGELDGKDYFFITEKEFVSRIENGDFIEHVHFAGERYGTNRYYVENLISEKKICIIDVDIQGAKMIKNSGFKGILVFIKPPCFDELQKR